MAPIGDRKRDKSIVASGANLELKQLHLERINNSVGGKRESAASRFWRSDLKVVFLPCSVKGLYMKKKSLKECKKEIFLRSALLPQEEVESGRLEEVHRVNASPGEERVGDERWNNGTRDTREGNNEV